MSELRSNSDLIMDTFLRDALCLLSETSAVIYRAETMEIRTQSKVASEDLVLPAVPRSREAGVPERSPIHFGEFPASEGSFSSKMISAVQSEGYSGELWSTKLARRRTTPRLNSQISSFRSSTVPRRIFKPTQINSATQRPAHRSDSANLDGARVAEWRNGEAISATPKKSRLVNSGGKDFLYGRSNLQSGNNQTASVDKMENEGKRMLCTCGQLTPGRKLGDPSRKCVTKSGSFGAFGSGLAYCVKRENPIATASSFSKSNNCSRSQLPLHTPLSPLCRSTETSRNYKNSMTDGETAARIPKEEEENRNKELFHFQNNSERNAYCPTRRPVPPDFPDIPCDYKCPKHSSGLETRIFTKNCRYLLPATAQSRSPIVALEAEEEDMENHQGLWLRLNHLIGGYANLTDSDVPELGDSSCALTAARYRGSMTGRVVSGESAARLAEHNRVSSPFWHQEGNTTTLNKQTTFCPGAREVVTGRYSSESEAEKDLSEARTHPIQNQEDSQDPECPCLLRPIYSSQETADHSFARKESKHWDTSETGPWEDSRRNKLRGQYSPLPQQLSSTGENSEEKPNPSSPDRMESLVRPLSRNANGSDWARRRREEGIPLLDSAEPTSMHRAENGVFVENGQHYNGLTPKDKFVDEINGEKTKFKSINNRNSQFRHSTCFSGPSLAAKKSSYRKRSSLVAALSNSVAGLGSKQDHSRLQPTCCSPEDLKLFQEDPDRSSGSGYFERNNFKSKSLYVSQPVLNNANSTSLSFGVTNPELLRFGNGNCLDKIAHLRKTKKKPLLKVYQLFSAPSNSVNLPARSAPPWSARFTDIWKIFGGAGSSNRDQRLLKRSHTLGSLVHPSPEEEAQMKEETETIISSQETKDSSTNFGQFTRIKSLPATPVRKKLSAQSEDSHVVVERIYCVRQVLHKVSEEYSYSYNNSGQEDVTIRPPDRPQATSFRSLSSHQFSDGDSVTPVLGRQSLSTSKETSEPLELPQRLMRRKSQRSKASMRRSRSQPMHSPGSDEDIDHRSGFTISIPSRNGDSGIISAATSSSEDAGSDGSGRSSRDHPCAPSVSFRSSTYSTNSSVTTSSVGSSENSQERSSWDTEPVILAEALWDHVTMQPEELQFSVGDVIQVCDWSVPDFWFGTCKDRSGWFPASHVRLLANQNVEDTNMPNSEITGDSNDENNCNRQNLLRRSVLQELISTERDYFSLLRNLIEGFLYQARRRVELFPAEKILIIFGNLEQIYELHRNFLSDLENSLDMSDPDSSRVGHCFLKHESAFEIYSDYCNNQPLSCSELASLYRQASYRQFFEACRLLRGMPELSLDAFLLTPVQRICKYPLQLAELVKSTNPSHADFVACTEALMAMRKVARIINDRKRRLEHLQKIATWQKSVESWQGPDLVEESSILIHSGELKTCRCLKNGSQSGTKDVIAFLFDHTFVLCKKDILKRNQLIFKDRVSLRDAKWESVSDGKDSFFGVSVKDGWKLYSKNSEEFCYLFTVKNHHIKMEWMLAIRDQEYVKKSKECSLPPSEQEKRIALSALRAPNPNNATKIHRKAVTMVVTNENCIIPESKSVPSKMWNKLNNNSKAQK